MFKHVIALAVLTAVFGVVAGEAPKKELRGLIAEDDFKQIESACKVCRSKEKDGDWTAANQDRAKFMSIIDTLALDPEGWTSEEVLSKGVQIDRIIAIYTKLWGQPDATNGCVLLRNFYDASGRYVAAATDYSDFVKRWMTQTRWYEKDHNRNWDGIRRKEVTGFMSAHADKFPDGAARVKFIDQLASAGIRTKALDELKADLVADAGDGKQPAQPDQPNKRNAKHR